MPHDLASYRVPLPSDLRSFLSSSGAFDDEELAAISAAYTSAPSYSIFRQVQIGPEKSSPGPDMSKLPVASNKLKKLDAIDHVYINVDDNVDDDIDDDKTTNALTSIPHSYQSASLSLSSSNAPAVIVDRVCAEAVLRGADIFNVGILSSRGDVVRGTEVYVWGDVSDNHPSDTAVTTKRGKRKKNNRGVKVKHFKGDVLYLGVGVCAVDSQVRARASRCRPSYERY